MKRRLSVFALCVCLLLAGCHGQSRKVTEGTAQKIQAYVENGILFISEDDGGTYRQLSLPEELAYGKDVWFYDSDTGVMIAPNEKEQEEIYLYKTTDGGRTWNGIGAPKQQSSLHDAVNGFVMYSKECYVIGYRYWGVGTEHPQCYLTTDGGETWSFMELPIPELNHEQFRYAEPYEMGERDGKLYCTVFLKTTTHVGENGTKKSYYVVVSSDGGETWEIEETDIGLAPDDPHR